MESRIGDLGLRIGCVAKADEVMLPGEAELEDLADPYGLDVPDTDYLTIGGYVFGHLGRLPKVGDVVRVGGMRIEVLQMEGRRVGQVRLVRESKKP